MKGINVIILAGGESTRFAPLRNKNCYPFLGIQTPILQINKLKKNLPTSKIIVVYGKDNYKEAKNISNPKDISVVIQEGEGMAGAALTALKKIKVDSDVLIVNMNDFFGVSLFFPFWKYFPS